jgi:hypothetical protein
MDIMPWLVTAIMENGSDESAASVTAAQVVAEGHHPQINKSAETASMNLMTLRY